MNFENKTVLITGASSGIGKEFSIQLAAMGADLILSARSKHALEALASQLKGNNPNINVTVIPLDLCDTGSVKSLYANVKDMSLSVDYLINNAGVGRFCQFEDEDFATYQKMLSLNINALTELSYLYLPEMKLKDAGGIINVASTGSFQPLPYQAVYGASKAYVLSFSESLSGELLDSNVHVMALCPGVTESNFMKNANADTSNMKFTTASEVVTSALKAFRKRRIYSVVGCVNYLTSLLPRFLTRHKIVKIVADMFRDGVLR